MSADSGRENPRLLGVLSLYGAPPGYGSPMLEVRLKRICRTPPYNQPEARDQLIADLRGLSIPRLNAEPALADKRPNIPLDELTTGRAERLLNLVDHWIEEIRAHAQEAETTNEM